jgi:hypothetical protein
LAIVKNPYILQSPHVFRNQVLIVNRRPFVHLLLALILLVSQQIGLSHAMSHGGDESARVGKLGRLGTSGKQAVGQAQSIKAINSATTTLAKNTAPATPAKLLLDQSCQDCLFLAQLGAALPGKLPVSKQAAIDTAPVLVAGVNWHATRSPSPFLSRAPPLV